MIGLGDVTVIESVGLTNGLDGRCEGMRGIKDVFESRMSPVFGLMGWWYHLQKWSRLGRSGLRVRRVQSLDLGRLNLSCLLNSKWRCQVDNWIHEDRTKHLGDFFAFV